MKYRKFCTLLRKGPNYGENKRTNWNKAIELTMIGLTEWIREENRLTNTKYQTQMVLWLEEVEKHIKIIVDLKRKVQIHNL